MQGTTTIALQKSTLQKLLAFKEYSRESYDEVLNKLIAIVSMAKRDSEGELSAETRSGIIQARKGIASGRGIKTRELMARLGIE